MNEKNEPQELPTIQPGAQMGMMIPMGGHHHHHGQPEVFMMLPMAPMPPAEPGVTYEPLFDLGMILNGSVLVIAFFLLVGWIIGQVFH